MIQLLSPDQMRRLEARYLEETGLPSIELMERAAEAILDVIEQRLGGCEGHSVGFACGPGGNGGDGYAAARLFASQGGKAIVVPVSDEAKLAGDARANCQRAHDTPRVFFQDANRLDAMPRPELWVDAMFGIGLTRPLGGAALTLARRMAGDRAMGSMILSIDIASGLSGLSGQNLGGAVAADSTITFEYAKLGHALLDGPALGGELITASIGIPSRFLPNGPAGLIELADLKHQLPPRARNTHKGSYGHLLIIAGSMGMAGAAMLAAMAAVRSGAGLVTVACPASIVPLIQIKVPPALCVPLPEADGAIAPEAVPLVSELLRGKSAVVVGPGLSTRAPAALVEAVLLCGLPALIDADALNLIARNPDLKRLLRAHQLITPHPGEAKRLLDRDLTDPAGDAMALQALGCTALLKGATTLIAGEALHLSASGSPGMAKGGSGDTLAGLIGALMAQGFDVERAACLGSELHGRAGEYAAQSEGVISMTAEDLIAHLKEAFSLAQ